MPKVPTPCIGVCKFERRGPAGRHCRGCSMTKVQKTLAKRASKAGPKAAGAFAALVMAQQAQMGRYAHWRGAYLARCLKTGARVPKVVRRAE